MHRCLDTDIMVRRCTHLPPCAAYHACMQILSHARQPGAPDPRPPRPLRSRTAPCSCCTRPSRRKARLGHPSDSHRTTRGGSALPTSSWRSRRTARWWAAAQPTGPPRRAPRRCVHGVIRRVCEGGGRGARSCSLLILTCSTARPVCVHACVLCRVVSCLVAGACECMQLKIMVQVQQLLDRKEALVQQLKTMNVEARALVRAAASLPHARRIWRGKHAHATCPPRATWGCRECRRVDTRSRFGEATRGCSCAWRPPTEPWTRCYKACAAFAMCKAWQPVAQVRTCACSLAIAVPRAWDLRSCSADGATFLRGRRGCTVAHASHIACHGASDVAEKLQMLLGRCDEKAALIVRKNTMFSMVRVLLPQRRRLRLCLLPHALWRV